MRRPGKPLWQRGGGCAPACKECPLGVTYTAMSAARSLILASAGFLLSGLSAQASVCDDPGRRSYVAGNLVEHGTSRIDAGAGQMAQQSRGFDLLLATRAKQFRFGFRHEYRKFNFAGIEPQTNAHLHVSSFPLHWGSGDFRLSLAPGLAASSNVLGKPEKYRRDTLRLAFAAIHQRPLGERVKAWYGLCADDSFGAWRLYPSVGVSWEPQSQWEVELGFPSSAVRYEFSRQVSTTVAISPDGNEWHVMDRHFKEGSQFRYRAYALEWTIRLRPGRHLDIAASVGRQLRNRLEMTLQNGDRVDVSAEPSARVGAQLRWRF